MLYYKINFDQHILNLLKKIALETTDHLVEKKLYAIDAKPTVEELDEINNIFTTRGLSKIISLLCFKRKVPTLINYDFTHVDYHSLTDSICNTTIVVPIYGYEGSVHYWLDGSYSLEFINPFVKFYSVKWKNQPILLDKIEITEGVWLTNASKPHSVVTASTGYRLVCTIRLQHNETVEQIAKAFGN